jgi:enoyl-CoA hydratase
MANTLEILETKIEAGIMTVTINREDKLNALNIAFFMEMDMVLDEIYENPEIKGIILTGKGPKAFAAGADISEFMHFNGNEGKKLSRNGHNVLNRIESCPKPFIAAVNGFALGGGCELTMACHLRYASTNAKFGQPEVNLGVIPGYGGTQRLIQLIGKGKALELLLTADMINADQALTLGLINGVTAPEELMTTCIGVMQKIISKGPIAIAKTIECVNSYFKDGIIGFTTEVNLFGECFDTSDFKEGTNAFAEKRKAVFKGS